MLDADANFSCERFEFKHISVQLPAVQFDFSSPSAVMTSLSTFAGGLGGLGAAYQ